MPITFLRIGTLTFAKNWYGQGSSKNFPSIATGWLKAKYSFTCSNCEVWVCKHTRCTYDGAMTEVQGYVSGPQCYASAYGHIYPLNLSAMCPPRCGRTRNGTALGPLSASARVCAATTRPALFPTTAERCITARMTSCAKVVQLAIPEATDRTRCYGAR